VRSTQLIGLPTKRPLTSPHRMGRGKPARVHWSQASNLEFRSRQVGGYSGMEGYEIFELAYLAHLTHLICLTK
jgi:hypothetical protein